MYTASLTAALGGVTQRQLAHWRNGRRPLLVPEANHGRSIRYSFRDLVAIRTMGALRTGFPLQRIRTAVAHLQRLDDVEHLSRYRLVGDGRTIVWAAGDELVDLLARPGQRVLITMHDVLDAFVGWTGATIVPLRRPKPGVSIDPLVLGGFPVVEDTRIPYDTIAGLADDGLDTAAIRFFYPTVTRTGVEGAVAFDDYVASYAA